MTPRPNSQRVLIRRGVILPPAVKSLLSHLEAKVLAQLSAIRWSPRFPCLWSSAYHTGVLQGLAEHQRHMTTVKEQIYSK